MNLPLFSFVFSVRAFGIIGGGAVSAAAGTVGALSTLPYVLPAATAAVVGKFLAIIILILICSCFAGAHGVGGSMLVAQNSCLGPFFSTSVSGSCCLIVLGLNGVACPDTCPGSDDKYLG